MSAVNWEALARAETHPLRVEILEAILAHGPISPNGLVPIVGSYLARVGYHVTELSKAGLIELVDTKQRRGATEHFYEAVRGG